MNDVSIKSISLNLEEDWELKEDNEATKVWYNKFGDNLSLSFFSLKPDLPEEITDIFPLRNLYRNLIAQSNGAIVEVEKEYVNSLVAIKNIFKFALQPSGFAFLASLTIPRKDFSIVFKVQCNEQGITGKRESVVLDRAIRDNLVNIETREGWFFDPYDPEFKSPILSNMADREEYDTEFPKHPLSRARRTLKMLKENMKFSDEILNAPKYFINLV
jgi:hypothetical protein